MKGEEVVEYIKDSIIRGRYSAGEKIVEVKVCKDLGLGRSIVREALRHLEQEGFIDRIPHASPTVKGLSQRDIVQIYDLLGVLEGLSMRIATPTITDKDMKEIETLINRMEQKQNSALKIYQSNMTFHKLLTELGGNTRLIAFSNSLREQARRMSLQSFYNPEQIASSIVEHREILDAVKERKPKHVETLIREHYLSAKNRLIRHINATL